MFSKVNKKAISPLIATILLVVVAVAIIGIVLSWGKGFTNTTLSKASSIEVYSESEIGFYLNLQNSINGRTTVSYNPPQNTTYNNLTIVGYGLLGYTTNIVPLEPPITISKSQTANIDHGIILPEFDLVLYLDNNTMITKFNLKQEIKQPSSCPEGFIPVPGNHLYGTMNERGGFCVMKYHAKNDTGSKINSTCITGLEGSDSNLTVKSVPEIAPSVNINYCAAKKSCENSGYILMNNSHWMTIARNIELNELNYVSGNLGEGFIFRGHYNNNPSLIIEANSDDSNNFYLINSPNSDQRRTLYLSNGEIIWDFTGNAWNILEDLVLIKDHADGFYTSDDTEFNSGNDNLFLTDYYKGSNNYYLKFNQLGNTIFNYKDIYLLNSKYNAVNNGIGIYHGNSNRGSVSETITFMMRGGDKQNGQYSGLMELTFPNLSSNGNTVGFRCVK
ncbi:hypothetical protein GW796_03935 [archaeon]|nr:hypothetical protein [archaeon]NCP97422.1 hypothetical protein [archaeon]NCQ07246.1 hypothetical protein [archaeon]NCQ51042.1 hypothetical protein [archaeon]NCT58484.1 hypothetical protein [archaeon]